MPRKRQEVQQVVDDRLSDYEMVYIVSPEVDEEALDSRIESSASLSPDATGS